MADRPHSPAPSAETGPGPGSERPPGAVLGLGLAAVGRPGYINLGRDRDLPPGRGVEDLRRLTHELLDLAWERGVRHFDAARSYGRAEEFLAGWLARGPRPGAVVSSKWGYTYTADWQVQAEAHEVKDHSLATFERQVAETRALLDGRLDVYQIHSVTPDSPALTDRALHRALAELAGQGVLIGFSTSGPAQADAVRAALEVEVDGERLFRCVQSTWNPLEPSVGPALAEAHAAGLRVMVKEAMANGRLAAPRPPEAAVLGALAEEAGAAPDALALAVALHQPWADVVLSGAATPAQLESNLAARTVRLAPAALESLAGIAEEPAAYWRHRAELPWS